MRVPHPQRVMRTPGILLLVLLVLCPSQSIMAEDRARVIRVTAEYVELSHEALSKTLAAPRPSPGPALHAAVRALVAKRNARIIETSILTVLPSHRATAESFAELIYPTEYEPPGLGCHPASESLTPTLNPSLRPGSSTAFETRNVGVSLEIEPTLNDNGRTVDLRLAPEILEYLRFAEWLEYRDEWGDASLGFPIFGSQRVNLRLTLEVGRFALAGVLTPIQKKAGGLDSGRKTLLFVKADVLFADD